MRRLIISLCCFFVLISPVLARASAKDDYEDAYKIYLAGGACMAAYSDRYGQLTNKYLEQDGWQIEKFSLGGETVDARFLLAQKQSDDGKHIYILAFVGTENDKDMKANLKVKKIYFAGSNIEDFSYYAAKQGMPATAPKVHRGFHEFVQVGLKATTQDSEGNPRYLTDALVANSDRKVLLVGHSRGGAAAILAGARLISMGVKPEQIEIITFGAPAVGNDAFADAFSPVLNLTRVVISGDPVTGALQSLVGGYKQFGRELRWEMPTVAHNPHEMATYTDLAIKNYYDKREQAVKMGYIVLPRSATMPETPWGKVYIAPIKNNLPDALSKEFWYIKQSLSDEYRKVIPGYVIADDESNDKLLKRAADAGCRWLLVSEVGGYRQKDERNVYYISLTQVVYNVDTGKLFKAAAYSTGTYNLTPLTAFMHVNKSMNYDWLIVNSGSVLTTTGDRLYNGL